MVKRRHDQGDQGGGPEEPLMVPFMVLIDSREQAPYTFCDLRADAKQGNRPLLIRYGRIGLPSGDYSIALPSNCPANPGQVATIRSMHDRVAIERKSLADLYGTLGQGRERFVRELDRLNQLEYAAVVVEASWDDILLNPPPHSALNPKTIHRSVIAWEQRYPRVRWWMAGSRRLAEITTFRILERWYRENVHGN